MRPDHGQAPAAEQARHQPGEVAAEEPGEAVDGAAQAEHEEGLLADAARPEPHRGQQEEHPAVEAPVAARPGGGETSAGPAVQVSAPDEATTVLPGATPG